MRPLPTLADVARLAGVSTATVSRVLNAPERVREETRERVTALQTETRRRLDAARDQAYHQAEEARRAASSAAWWFFLTAFLSGSSAVVGGLVAAF